MATSPLPQEHNPKIMPLFSSQEPEDAEALARYWDARLQGRSGDPTEVDPDLRVIVHLLEHYREVAGPLSLGTPVPDALSPLLWRRLAQVAALVLMTVMGLLFASNTLLSPRSWLLSSTQDPDWIPWVSDDWLSAQAATATSLLSEDVNHQETMEDLTRGA